MNNDSTKSGLCAVGFMTNFSTCLQDLNSRLKKENQVTWSQLNQDVDEASKEYYSKFGYTKSPDRTPLNRETANYIRFKLPYKNASGEDLYGWFSRPSLNISLYKGVTWGTAVDFQNEIKSISRFIIGNMFFDVYEDGVDFLESIAMGTIPESWKYKNHHTKMPHPILKSYLENILLRLLKEEQNGKNDKLIYSEDKKYVMFNANLLDKYFHDVIIVGTVIYENNELHIQNPYWSKSQLEIRKLGFGKQIPTPPQFFDDVNEVIFQTSWDIDRDFDTFTHIIEERQNRFPDSYQDQKPEVLAKKLDDAINFAVAVAQRNYKFIVPMYRPQLDKIQLLMPIYLQGAYCEKPDFALILTPEKETQLYIPETILPLDAAYQNARLIAKPDEAWLNPDQM